MINTHLSSWRLILLSILLQACVASYVNEMQIYQKKCLGEDKFECRDGGCINREQQCDQVLNCNDGSDENFCVEHAPDARMCIKTGQFLCMDAKICIPRVWLCDNRTDCNDGSDEDNCTALVPPKDAKCKGFQCASDGKCISRYQVCNIRMDCQDGSDELPDSCRFAVGSIPMLSDFYYEKKLPFYCLDRSRIIDTDLVCDNLADCDDQSDEGEEFCKTWKPQCHNMTCPTNTNCAESRNGSKCYCYDFDSHEHNEYNNQNKSRCESFNMCRTVYSVCSQMCEMGSAGMYYCSCAKGYKLDKYKIGHRCFAEGPEALLFFTTRSDIKYIKIRSREIVTVATGLQQVHGVNYDGNFLYWVEIEKGHQCIVRAKLNNIEGTKEVIVSIGLEDVGDIAVDWLGNNIYFGDSERGTINVCRPDGSVCIVLKTESRLPKHVALDPQYGNMYWADWKNGPVIMGAKMDGSSSRVLVTKLHNFAAGVAVDSLNRRLYFSDKVVKGISLESGVYFTLFHDPIYHPYALVPFESSVYWSDWNSNSIIETDKLYEFVLTKRKYEPYKLNTTVYGLCMYHPLLINRTQNPCENHNCSHICLVTSNVTSTCACPDGMRVNGSECQPEPTYEPLYLVVAGGSVLTRIEYEVVGNPETHATHFDIGRVQAMAYDNTRDTLYIYDGQRKSINFVNMTHFNLGITEVIIDLGLGNVVDMAYDYVADMLYFLDAGRGFLEVVSLSTKERAIVLRFRDKIPISMTLLSDYGYFLVAVEDSSKGTISIESYGLDGSEMLHIISNDLMGPHIQLRFEPNLGKVFIADGGNQAIDTMQPEGTDRDSFRDLSTSIVGLAVVGNHVFWTDRESTRFYWANAHDSTPAVRKNEFSIFPNNTYLHLLATVPRPSHKNPLLSHPCRHKSCSDVCVQTRHLYKDPTGYKCLCHPGLLNLNGLSCTEIKICEENEGYCHISNTCFGNEKRCDGNKDCIHGEDEEDCQNYHPTTSTTSTTPAPIHCKAPYDYACNGICIQFNDTCDPEVNRKGCRSTEFQCAKNKVCIPRWEMCDGHRDCPDGTDEHPSVCQTHNCHSSEFMCVTSGSCILASFRCDNEPDCPDGSDEVDCDNTYCAHGYYRCNDGECIELSKRCDANNDCEDSSDELACEESGDIGFKEEFENCPEWEYTCELDRHTCIPLSARCDGKSDCPNGTDEVGCLAHRCNNNAWKCDEDRCLDPQIICNGVADCEDGSDETSEACQQANKTSIHTAIYPSNDCKDGFLCKNGQCVEWKQVCDSSPNCFDGSDENGLCLTSCELNPCSNICHPTPTGPHCSCLDGFELMSDKRMCADINECEQEICSQACYNLPGTYVCSCHYGYALRSDRHTCKATTNNMAVFYVSSNTVRSKTIDGNTKTEYNNNRVNSITSMDLDVRGKKLYVTSENSGMLIEVNENHKDVIVTNIGRPTKVAVDWITGNVYFVDHQKEQSFIRVCNFEKQRCAKVHFLPMNSEVTSFIVDPATRRMFYCLTVDQESTVYAVSMTGLYKAALTTVHNCTGLAVDSFTKKLYVAETGPAQLLQMNYEGQRHKKIVTEDRHLEAPHGLVIFEDHIYFLVANSFELNRCALYGEKKCETYLRRVFNANTFAIRHESVQRNDFGNQCEGVNCTNVCVVGIRGPMCVCPEGQGALDGECDPVKKQLLPLFNGYVVQDYLASGHEEASVHIAVGLVTMFVMSLVLGIAYIVIRIRRSRAVPGLYHQVRFTRSESGASEGVCEGSLPPSASVIPPSELGQPSASTHQEYTNPFEFIRSAWRHSFKRQRPVIANPGIHIDIPQPSDSVQADSTSDTESDQNYAQETKGIIRESDA